MPRSAYKIEFQRQRLASKNDLVRLKSMYSPILPEIEDLNTSKFWDEKFVNEESLDKQDGMTKDRIKTAVGFIPRGGIKILDIGAGLGFVERLLDKDKDKEVHANDFSKISIKILNKKFKGHFSHQSIYKLKYQHSSFDVILALEILEHIPPSKIFSVLNSINNLLKKSGILIVSVPMNEGLENMKTNPNGHVRMYTEDLIRAELGIAGFEIIEYKTLFAFPNFYNTKTVIAKLTKRKYPNNIVMKAMKI